MKRTETPLFLVCLHARVHACLCMCVCTRVCVSVCAIKINFQIMFSLPTFSCRLIIFVWQSSLQAREFVQGGRKRLRWRVPVHENAGLFRSHRRCPVPLVTKQQARTCPVTWPSWSVSGWTWTILSAPSPTTCFSAAVPSSSTGGPFSL